jgi:hypothetical protein
LTWDIKILGHDRACYGSPASTHNQSRCHSGFPMRRKQDEATRPARRKGRGQRGRQKRLLGYRAFDDQSEIKVAAVSNCRSCDSDSWTRARRSADNQSHQPDARGHTHASHDGCGGPACWRVRRAVVLFAKQKRPISVASYSCALAGTRPGPAASVGAPGGAASHSSASLACRLQVKGKDAEAASTSTLPPVLLLRATAAASLPLILCFAVEPSFLLVHTARGATTRIEAAQRSRGPAPTSARGSLFLSLPECKRRLRRPPSPSTAPSTDDSVITLFRSRPSANGLLACERLRVEDELAFAGTIILRRLPVIGGLVSEY